MIPRLTRIVGSLAFVIICYWAYALLAVPFIEPAAERPDVPPGGAPPVSPENQVKALNDWFVEPEWELHSPKILETSQGMLLLKNYQNLGDGRVRIAPCTMIFLPEGNFASEKERNRRAIILRAPQGAVLQFEQFDLKQAKVGKLIAGNLIGQVTIRSDQRDPGPQDDLEIRTSDVDLTEQRLWTSKPVQFKLGPNNGQGRGMVIEMANQEVGKEPRQGFRGMTLLELKEEVEMHLHPGQVDLIPGGRPGGAAPKTPQTAPPVDVTCQGPFRFDFLKNVATFTDRVDVSRINATGPADQLTAQVVSLFFEVAPGSGAPTPQSEGAASNLQPIRLEAVGNPVIVQAPANDARARGQELVYNLKTGGMKLRGETEAFVLQAGREVSAREIHYEPGPDGKLGQFIALGRGWFRGARPEDRGQNLEARWGRRLYFRPADGLHLLSIEGDGHIEAVGKGALDGEEIHVWMRDVTPAVRPQDAQPPRQELQPQRLLANGKVKIDAPQWSGEVGQLQAWFEAVAIAPATRALQPQASQPQAAQRQVAQPQGAHQQVVQPGTHALNPLPQVAAEVVEELPPPQPAEVPPAQAANMPPAFDPSQPRFFVSGEHLRVKLKLRGPVVELSEAFVEHNVRLWEIQKQPSNEKPLLVMGRQLHIEAPQPQDSIVTVQGEPSYVEARGITMSSKTIHVHRNHNVAWTDGAGVMTIPVDRNLEGQAIGQPQMLNVNWQGQMRFDGQVARFDRQVVAQHGVQTMTTELLEVTMNRLVKFGAAGGADRPQVELIACRQGVVLESQNKEGERLVSIDKLQALEIAIQQMTGDLSGQGPGRLESVRFDTGEKAPLALGPAAQPAPAAGEPNKPRVPHWEYLAVYFERELSGNVRRRQLTFENQVRAIHGPVPHWDAKLDPDRPAGWGEEGVLLTTDRLTVVEVPLPGSKENTYELEAVGNTKVENTAYTAHAGRLTYGQAKDLLILEGIGPGSARLYRQQRVGAPWSEAAARKIYFWPKINRMEVEKSNFLDLSMPPGAAKQNR